MNSDSGNGKNKKPIPGSAAAIVEFQQKCRVEKASQEFPAIGRIYDLLLKRRDEEEEGDDE